MSASKQKGTAAETAVANWLKANGYPHAERRALNGNTDKGDITGLPGCVIEVKNCRTMTLAEWITELRAEIRNAGALTGVVIHKRKGTTNVGDWYATMPASVWLALMLEGEAP